MATTSPSDLPNTQLAVIVSRDSTELRKIPVPDPGPGEVLIQNVAVASNPKDWKIPLWRENYSFVEGNDIAGYIVKLGEGVTEYQVGDRVAAFTKMATQDNKVGISEAEVASYLTRPLVWRVCSI